MITSASEAAAQTRDRLRGGLSARRVITGLLVAAVGIGSIFSAQAFGILILLIGVAGAYELSTLAKRSNADLSLPVVIFGVVAYVALAYFQQMQRYESGLIALIAAMAIVFAFAAGIDHFGARVGWTTFSALYAGKLLSYFIVLRQEHNGLALVLWTVVIVALTDTVGMIVGLGFGRRKLWPQLSPSKTWEGAIAAFAVACIAGTLLGTAPQLKAPWAFGLLFSAVISLAAQLGDLAESALKRDAHVKDSGQLLAEHGGVLDRFDSYVLAAAAAYALLLWSGRL
jgi:phosphatidate cytidylyltransferase